MKKTIKLLTGTVLICYLLFATGCGKNAPDIAAATNWAYIFENGVAQPMDSIQATVKTINGNISEVDMIVYLNHKPGYGCSLFLYFSPSDPAYVAGTTINIKTGKAALEYSKGPGSDYWDDILNTPSGYITIAKNDVSARRLEGSITDCVATNTGTNGSPSVTISGNFAITYPPQ